MGGVRLQSLHFLVGLLPQVAQVSRLGGGGRVPEPGVLTFFSRMPGLLGTSCAMRKREASWGQLAEQNQQGKHSLVTVKPPKTKQNSNKKKVKKAPGSAL